MSSLGQCPHGPARFGAPVLVILVAMACAATEDVPWLGTVDTLRGGVVLIRNPADGKWRSRSPWRLIQEFKIGTRADDGPRAFGEVADLAIDRVGRVYVLDGQAQEVRVFGLDGGYIRTVGRLGHGPGELIAARGIQFDPTGRLWVMNQGNARYSVFDTSGALLKEFPAPTWGRVRFAEWLGVFDSLGVLYDQIAYPSATGLRFDYARYDTTTGQFVDTIPGLASIRAPLFWGIRRGTSRGWWMGNAAQYRLYHVSFNGDTTRIVQRPYEPIPLATSQDDSAPKETLALRRRVRRLPTDLQPPSYQPIFFGFVEDEDGYLWVMLTPASDARGTPFDVFDAGGRYLGVVTAPYHLAPQPPPILGNDLLYGVTKDDLDVPYVVALRIVRSH